MIFTFKLIDFDFYGRTVLDGLNERCSGNSKKLTAGSVRGGGFDGCGDLLPCMCIVQTSAVSMASIIR